MFYIALPKLSAKLNDNICGGIYNDQRKIKWN